LKRRFEQNQNDCTFTVLSLLPTLSEQVFDDMAVEELWAKLQELRKEQKQKLEQQKQEKEQEKEQENENETNLNQEKPVDEQEVKEETVSQPHADSENAEAVVNDQQANETKPESVPEVSLPITVDQQPSQEANISSGAMENSIGSLANSSLSEGSELTSSQKLEVPSEEKATEQKSKYALWEEIKIKSENPLDIFWLVIKYNTKPLWLLAGFTRSLTSLYCVSLLTLLTHTELNLLGRFTYVSSIASLNRSEPTIRIERSDSESKDAFMDIDVEGKFLSFSWWLLHKGWKGLAERVEAAVHEVFGRYDRSNVCSSILCLNIIQTSYSYSSSFTVFS
jgi:peroxin-3